MGNLHTSVPQFVYTVCMYVVFVLQWNLSIKDKLNKAHLSNEDTIYSPNHMELCTNMPLN